MMKGTIELEGMEFFARHGCMEHEKVAGNRFLVDFRAGASLDKAAQTDALEDTLNYGDIYKLVAREMARPSNLLEHVAGRIGESIFREMAGVTSVDIELCKVNPPMGADCDGASVELHLTSEKTEKTV